MGLCRQEHWSGLPLPTPGDLPDPGINPTPHESPALAGWFFTTAPPGKALGEGGCCILFYTHTHPRSIRGRDTHRPPPINIPELPRNLEHHKHFYVLSICLSESLCSDNCHDERIGGFKSLCQGMGVMSNCPHLPQACPWTHVHGHTRAGLC